MPKIKLWHHDGDGSTTNRPEKAPELIGVNDYRNRRDSVNNSSTRVGILSICPP